MPDQTVKVTFTPPSTFTFKPEEARMSAAGKIILHRDPGTANWTFVSVNGLPSPEFTWRVKGNGSSIEIDDAHSSIGDYSYTVTVSDATGNHTSPAQRTRDTVPPMIMNQ